jgi:hypothetical protein
MTADLANNEAPSFYRVPFPEVSSGNAGTADIESIKIVRWFEHQITEGAFSPQVVSLAAANLAYISQAYWGRDGKAKPRARLSSEQKTTIIAERKARAQARFTRPSTRKSKT